MSLSETKLTISWKNNLLVRSQRVLISLCTDAAILPNIYGVGEGELQSSGNSPGHQLSFCGYWRPSLRAKITRDPVTAFPESSFRSFAFAIFVHLKWKAINPQISNIASASKPHAPEKTTNGLSHERGIPPFHTIKISPYRWFQNWKAIQLQACFKDSV